MLKKIEYKKLFGIFNYDIKLDDDGVTIITGPNGFGKSTILKSMNAFGSFDIEFFWKLDFEEIKFYKEDSEVPICIKKNTEGLSIDDKMIDSIFLRRFFNKNIKRPFGFRRPYVGINDMDIDMDIDMDMDMDIKFMSGSEDSFDGMNNLRSVFIDEERSLISKYKELEGRFKSYSGKMKFIKEQRLLIEEKSSMFDNEKIINVIEKLPNKLKDKMNKVSSEYSSKANVLDSTYPNRLFETDNGISEEEYFQKTKDLDKKFEKLNKYNISDIEKAKVPLGFKDEHSKALKVYFEDFEEKYKVFEELVAELELFTDIINSRLKFKEVEISREKGVAVYKKGNGGKKEVLSLNQLSSGEKQEIILFYELIFESEKNIHLLIDEPEISLHIEWQLKFLEDLLKIVKLKSFKVTVATHSPQIINNHWDIQIDLGELYGN